MKKIMRTFLVFLFMLSLCSLTALAAPKLNKKSLTLKAGSTATLKMSGIGKNKVTWKTSNSKIATVDKNGKVTAKKPGNAKVTATVSKKTYTCKVTVKKVAVSSVKIAKTSAKISKGATLKLSAKVTPSNATNKGLSWSSSNKNVATVNNKGEIKAIKKGTATITVKSTDNKKKKATCKVTVTEQKSVKVSVSGAVDIYVGRSIALKASASPKNVVKTYKWTSSNTAIAKVDSKGVVTGMRAGTAKITASAVEGKGSATVTIKIKAPVLKVKDIEVSCKYKEADRSYKFTANDFTVKTVYTNGTKKASAFSLSVAPSSKTDANGNGTGSFNITVKADGITKRIVIPMKPFKVQAAAPVVTKTVTGITAETTLKAAADINEAVNAPITVYEKYSDGSKKATKSYKASATYNSANKNYVLTITSADGKHNTTLVIPAKASEKVITSISVACTLSEISSASEVTKNTLRVTAKYSDGSSANLEAYKVGVSYKDDAKEYTIKASTTDGKLSATTYVRAKQTQPVKTLTGIDVSCGKSEVQYEEKLSVSDFTVKGIYSDGSSSAIQNFTADVEYKDGFYIATVKAGGFTKELKIKVSNPPQVETEVETEKENTLKSVRCEISPGYVYVGEPLSQGQIKVYAVFENGAEEEVFDYQTTFTPQSAAGSYTFKVSYMNTSHDMTVEIREKQKNLTSVTFNSKVNRVFSDEAISKDMFVATGFYDDGSSGEITDYEMSVVNASGHNSYATVTMTYKEYTCSLQILSIVRTEPETVSFEYTPVAIKPGENIPRENIKVTAIDYSGNSTNISDFTIGYTPKDTTGTYSFDVSYKGFAQTFDVEVKE